jgi:hypothetical protein
MILSEEMSQTLSKFIPGVSYLFIPEVSYLSPGFSVWGQWTCTRSGQSGQVADSGGRQCSCRP